MRILYISGALLPSGISHSLSLREEFLYVDGRLKGGLKKALPGLLPDAVLSHHKQGFSVPDFGWEKALVRKFGSFEQGVAATYLNEAGF